MTRTLTGLLILATVLAAIAGWPVLLWLLASFALGLIVARRIAPGEDRGDEGAEGDCVGDPVAIRFLHASSTRTGGPSTS